MPISDRYCAACASEALEKVFQASSHHLANHEYSILRCARCKHCQAVGLNDAETLSKIYSKSFFDTSAQKAGPGSAIVKNARHRAKRLWKKYQPKEALDIGAGVGSFVEALSEYCNAEGIERSGETSLTSTSAAPKMHKADFQTCELKKKYDLITFWDVLSCFEQQIEVLEKAGAALHERGHIVLTAPMADSFTARLLGRFWPLWIPPVNQHFYSRQSIHEVARRSGLRICATYLHSKTVSLDFLVLKLLRALGIKVSASAVGKIPSIGVRVNTYDLLEVHLRKQ